MALVGSYNWNTGVYEYKKVMTEKSVDYTTPDRFRPLPQKNDNEIARLRVVVARQSEALAYWHRCYNEIEGKRAEAAKRAHKAELTLAARERRITRLLDHIDRTDKAFKACKEKRDKEFDAFFSIVRRSMARA